MSGLVTQTTAIYGIESLGVPGEIVAVNPDQEMRSIEIAWFATACQNKPVIEISDEAGILHIRVTRGPLTENCPAAERVRAVRIELKEPRDDALAILTLARKLVDNPTNSLLSTE